MSATPSSSDSKEQSPSPANNTNNSTPKMSVEDKIKDCIKNKKRQVSKKPFFFLLTK